MSHHSASRSLELYHLSDWLHQRFRFQFQMLAELTLVALHFSLGTG